MKLMVFGGTGFIGWNAVNHLKNKYEIIVLDKDLQRNRFAKGDNITLIECDINNFKEMEKAILSHKPDKILFLAALSSTPMFFDGTEGNPTNWVRTNTLAFTEMLGLANRCKVQKIVYASTSSIYSENPVPFREDQCITPKTFYEATLHAREGIANAFNRVYGLSSIGLRFFAVYGDGEKIKGKYANNISQFIWAMKNGKSPEIYGDGTQTRDFTYIKDVVNAIEKALESDYHGVLNIGTGIETDFKMIVKYINEVLHTSIKPKYVKNPLKAYVARTLADVSMAKKVLDWKARFSVKEGIKDMLETGKDYKT